MPYKLSHPEYLTLTGLDGTRYRGGDQEWYHDLWQRRAGCGPTTAAAMAISQGWIKLVGPIMLVGTLGYVVGTYFGTIVGNFLGA